MSNLPTGTVTLLLADVEGSTGLWQTQPAEMTAAVGRLDSIVSTVVPAHHGVRPVEQGEGDSFVVAFARASDAVACALALQRAPLAPITLRIGLHTGEVQLRGEANYVGSTINRAARVRDLAHGGQTVLTASTEELVVDRLPDGTWLRDVGSHELRGIPRPERVVQLCHQDLRVDFPALRSSSGSWAPHLPVPLTRFVGRTAELAELRLTVGHNRLVTLTGAGGVGKTRLAVQLSAQLAEDFDGAVHYVDLAPVTDPEIVGVTVARAMGLPDHPGSSTVDTLTRRIGKRTVLIVLDNCEHLLEATAGVVVALLSSCPAVILLATSREPLRIEAEATWQVPSLSLSDEAIELFTDRASHVRPGFSITDDNVGTITEICRRLDGIPLAIELAAARMRALSPAEVLDSLHDRFRLLTGGARTAVRRQQTLRASVDWSHSLLTHAEAVLFRRLAVFAGGFDLEAAVAVCGGGDVQRFQVLDQLTLLVEKSLVVAEYASERTRYRMLETIRQYALEKLGESGEADAVRTGHCDYYTGFAAQLDSVERVDFRRRVQQVEAELDNLRTAFAWSRDNGEHSRALELASSLQPLWQGRGLLREGLSWFEAILEHADLDLDSVPPAAHARALADRAVLDSYLSADDGMEQAQVAVEIARELDDPALLARALTACGYLRGFDIETAAPYFAEAIGLARETGDDWRLSQILARQAYGAAMTGEPDAAAAYGAEGSAIAEAVGDWSSANVCGWSLGMAMMMRADLRNAVDQFAATRAKAEADHDVIGMGVCLLSHGATLCNLGDASAAHAVANDALRAGAELGALGEGSAATILAAAALAAGDSASAWKASSGAWRDPSVQRGTVAGSSVAMAALAAGDLGAARELADDAVATLSGFHKMWALTVRCYVALAEGHPEQARRDAYEALSIGAGNGARLGLPDLLECLARLAIHAGDHIEAARLFGSADATRQRTGEVRFPMHDPGYQEAFEAARNQLGGSGFTNAWAEGAALSSDEAIARALRGRGERRRPASGWESLTPAELDVVGLVGQGLPNKDIAERLFISPRTVQAHLTHVYTKLGLTSRVQLAQEAARHA